MPRLTPPVVAEGSLSGTVQPIVGAGHGVRLRPWTARDAPLLVAVYADADIQRWHCKSIADVEEAEAMIGGWVREWRTESGAHWAITDSEDVVVGRVAMRKIDRIDGAAELSYWATPRWRGHGFVPAAVTEVTRWAFDLGFHRLSLEHSVANRASCRVAEKAGYCYEATLTSAARHVDGHHDMHLHAIIATAFRQANSVSNHGRGT